MNDPDFIIYLQKNHPYLYDIEQRIRKIKSNTGFGDISVTLTMRFGKVELSDIGEFHKTKYGKV